VIEMELVGVRLELPSNSPIVLLQEQNGNQRMLPIFIGTAEATSIALALEDVDTPRPMTHDLMRDVLNALTVNVKQVVITDLRDKTFYAELHIDQDGKNVIISSRPSDAVALAARMGTPLFASESVLEAAAYAPEPEGEDEAEAEEVLEQFREFIDNISPDDFES